MNKSITQDTRNNNRISKSVKRFFTCFYVSSALKAIMVSKNSTQNNKKIMKLGILKIRKGVRQFMKKRVFSAENKATIVLEVLRGERGINEIATENEIAPNQIRNWKSQALEQLPIIFDVKRDNSLKEKIAQQEKELETAYKKIGQLTTQVDWLEKKSAKISIT